jgi:hypothetical protein
MARKHTASFILELPLKTDPADERACAIILDAGRNIGNAVLGEGLHRLDLMRESRAYRAARKMSRGEPRSPERKARANEFKRLFEAFGFTGHALQKRAQERRDKCWIRDHLSGHVAQTAATRAFNAILQYAFGRRGRPKFRGRDRYNSFESKEARSTIIWRDGAVRIAGRVIPAILDPASAWQSEALRAKTKYCRIIRRDIRGRERWYVQLVEKAAVSAVSPVPGRDARRARCLDAIQAAKAWTGAEAFLRVASNGFEPASGKGFAFPHVTLGVRAGRSKKYHANHREAGDDVGLAVLPVSRAPESGEAPRGSLWPSG